MGSLRRRRFPAESVRAASLVAILLAVMLADARADLVWTPEGGWRNPASDVRATAVELLASSQAAFEAREYRDAATGLRWLLRRYPNSPEATPALRLLLDAQFLGQDYEAALVTIETLLKARPDADTVSEVVWRKYEIGSAFLAGRKRSFLGIPYAGGSYGVEILDSIVQRFPFLPFSDDALFHIAGYYFGRESYDEAELIYERLIRDYPQSEWLGIAAFQISASALKRLKGTEYDIEPLDKAELYLLRYQRTFPDGDKAEAVAAELKRIDAYRGERLLNVARFYLRDDKVRPAQIYLHKVIRDHPTTAAAEQARELIGSSRGNR
ncbi:MAG: outer membrane protein assembly factor BamD [Planctomycetota bacterium]